MAEDCLLMVASLLLIRLLGVGLGSIGRWLQRCCFAGVKMWFYTRGSPRALQSMFPVWCSCILILYRLYHIRTLAVLVIVLQSSSSMP